MNTRQKLQHCKRIVVKVGTSTITYPNGRLNLQRIEKLAWVLTDLSNQGISVTLVTSGSIGVGAIRLAYDHRPTDTREKQAAAAVGQAVLMQIYQNFFNAYHQTVAQILLTRDVIGSDERRENTLNTFETLFKMGVIPIVNANDTISTDELGFSDNDRLSAMVAGLLDADLLVLLTDINGLYDADPKQNENARRISFVSQVTDDIMMMAGPKGSKFSVGGMEAKLMAAKMCEEYGLPMVIALGEDPAILHHIMAGKDVGTCFGCGN